MCSSLSIYIIFYIESNSNSKWDTLHAQEILVPSDIYPRGWTKLSGTESIPTAVLYLFTVEKTLPFHCSVSSLDCHPIMDTEFVSTGQKPAKTTSWNSAKSALISANNPKIQQKAFNFQQSLGTKAVAAVQSGAEVPENFA